MTPLLLLHPHGGPVHLEPLAPCVPRIVLAWDVYRVTLHFIAHSQARELSWVGRVTVEPGETTPVYVIDQVRLLRQTSAPHQTVLDPIAVGEIAQEWITAAGNKGNENPCKFWGHTHPFPSTAPSGQDDRQMLAFFRGKFSPPFFIRGIFSPAPLSPAFAPDVPATAACASSAEFSVYDFTKGVVFRNVPWSVVDPEKDEEVLAHVSLVASVSEQPAFVTPEADSMVRFGEAFDRKGGVDDDPVDFD